MAAKRASDNTSVKDRIERVKRAMLATQRASWEQGVAAQALLELGETELVVLMAKEAIVRQDQQGRLAVVGHDGGVVDPAASGEAVLAAARITGDPQLQEGMERMAAYLLHDAPRTNDGILYHILSGPEVWSDATVHGPSLPGGRRVPRRGHQADQRLPRQAMGSPEEALFPPLG